MDSIDGQGALGGGEVDREPWGVSVVGADGFPYCQALGVGSAWAPGLVVHVRL